MPFPPVPPASWEGLLVGVYFFILDLISIHFFKEIFFKLCRSRSAGVWWSHLIRIHIFFHPHIAMIVWVWCNRVDLVRKFLYWISVRKYERNTFMYMHLWPRRKEQNKKMHVFVQSFAMAKHVIQLWRHTSYASLLDWKSEVQIVWATCKTLKVCLLGYIWLLNQKPADLDLIRLYMVIKSEASWSGSY